MPAASFECGTVGLLSYRKVRLCTLTKRAIIRSWLKQLQLSAADATALKNVGISHQEKSAEVEEIEGCVELKEIEVRLSAFPPSVFIGDGGKKSRVFHIRSKSRYYLEWQNILAGSVKPLQ